MIFGGWSNLGDVTGITDSQGNLQISYCYDAWGNSVYTFATGATHASDLATFNPLRYRGYVYDQELTTYYLQSRYYIPEIGRFLNADAFASTGQGLLGNNMFAYCGNNPVCRSDPSGLLYISPIIGLIEAAFSELDAAFDLLTMWLTGDGSNRVYLDGCPIVEALQDSPKMNGFIHKAIDRYKATGINHTRGKNDNKEFTSKEDGLNLYLSTQHFDYSVFVTTEIRTDSLFGMEYRAEQTVATVFVWDTYDFDIKAWNSAGNALNNIAAYLQMYTGVGIDYDWVAIYTYSESRKISF